MKILSRIILMALCILALATFLPWLYSLLLPDAVNEPYIEYSPISGKMVVARNVEDAPGGQLIQQANGDTLFDQTYTRNQRDSLLPQIHYTQLMARGTMPDTIAGRAVTLPEIKHSFYAFRSSPREINKPRVPLYLLMESMPERLQLQDPDQAFTLADDGTVEVIDVKKNEILPTPSRRFTETFKARGYQGPLRDASADITARKPRDEGYMLVDNNGALYHFKMQVGQPYLKAISLPAGVKAAKAYLQENDDPHDLAYFISEGDSLYLVDNEYNVYSLPVTGVNANRDNLVVMSNLINTTVRVSNDQGARWIAYDSHTYQPLASYAIDAETSAIERAAEWIFPFDLSFVSYTDSYARPRFSGWSWLAMPLGAILAIIVFVFTRRRGAPWGCTIGATVLTLFLGLYAFIPILLLRKP